MSPFRKGWAAAFVASFPYGLAALEEAGLVAAHRRPDCSPDVTILESSKEIVHPSGVLPETNLRPAPNRLRGLDSFTVHQENRDLLPQDDLIQVLRQVPRVDRPIR